MSGKENKISPSPPRLDLRLNLSPPRSNNNNQKENESASSSEISSKSSCVSSEADQEMLSSPEESSSLLLVGCPRCLMYIMLSDVDPKCPYCKSTMLLDVLSTDDNNTKT